MSKTMEKALDVSRSNAANAYLRTTVTTANGEVCACPAEWAGQFVEFTAMGADVYIRFGTSNGVQVDQSTASTNSGATAYTLTAGGKEPHLVIPAGTSKHERVRADQTFFAHVASAAGGKLYAVMATGNSA